MGFHTRLSVLLPRHGVVSCASRLQSLLEKKEKEMKNNIYEVACMYSLLFEKFKITINNHYLK